MLRQRLRLGFGGRGVAIHRRAPIGVQVQRLYLVLMILAAQLLVRADEAQDLDLLDDEIGLPRGLGKDVARGEG